MHTEIQPASGPEDRLDARATGRAPAAPRRSQPSHRAYLATRQFASLDGLRCLCILAVIWHHCPRPEGSRLASRGFLGVDMFFVLSGFLIVTLLLRERRRTSTIRLDRFYIRRTLRIFPVYYLILFAVTTALLALKPGSEMTGELLAGLPFLATYTINWAAISVVNLDIAWSLAAEEQFYLFWPAVEKYLRPKAVLAALGGVLVANQLINFRLIDPVFVALYGRYPQLAILQTTFTPIALGVLLAHALDDPRGHAAIARLVGWPGAPPAVAAGLLLLIAAAPGDLGGWPRLAVQAMMTMLLASLVVREDHVARPVLSWGPIRRIGLISYGMYLYHLWALHIVREGFGRLHLDGVTVLFPATVLVTILIAEASFRVVETPALRLKGRFGGTEGARPGRDPGWKDGVGS